MAISFKRYVDITSGVGAGANVGTRQLIGRFFDDNILIPTNSHVEFTSAADVADYFGSSSIEYLRAVFYFGWVSKKITSPRSVSFARWTPDAVAARIFGAKGAQSYTSYLSFSAGSFSLTLGGITRVLTGLDFDAVTSLADVAAVVQTAINLQTGTIWTGATVEWDSVNQQFNFIGGTTGATGASAATGTLTLGSNAANDDTVTIGVRTYTVKTALSTGPTVPFEVLRGATASDTIDNLIAAITAGAGIGVKYSTGTTANAAATAAVGTGDTMGVTAITTGSAGNSVVTTASLLSGSFADTTLTGGSSGSPGVAVAAGSGGSDVAGQLGWLSASAIFSDGADAQSITDVLTESAEADDNFGSFTFVPTLTEDEIVEAAEWNQAQNVKFMFSVRCDAANASALSTALADIGGVTLTLAPLEDEYPEQVPMMIEAATDYASRNCTQNYMFQIFDLTPSVTTNADADLYDGLRINYYGQTQTAGQLVQFYQRGRMMGQATDPVDQNTYANEQWLKDAAGAAIMTLLLALSKVSANTMGRSQIIGILQSVVNQALFNGTISPGKALTTVQQLYISEVTGDPAAWKQVQNIGYWLDVVFRAVVVDDVTEYEAVYTLVYSKDDVIRKVVGSDILI